MRKSKKQFEKYKKFEKARENTGKAGKRRKNEKQGKRLFNRMIAPSVGGRRVRVDPEVYEAGGPGLARKYWIRQGPRGVLTGTGGASGWFWLTSPQKLLERSWPPSGYYFLLPFCYFSEKVREG